MSQENIYKPFFQELDDNNNIRTQILDLTEELERVNKRLDSELHKIHLTKPDLPTICENAKQHIPELVKLYSKIFNLIPENEFYRYNYSFAFSYRDTVRYLALITFLKEGRLITKEEILETILDPTTKKNGKGRIDVQDYLLGLTFLSNELSRFCVNSMRSQNFEICKQINTFLNELNGGFKLLNFKNNTLRRRYDSLKYDLKKVEEVMYDIKKFSKLVEMVNTQKKDD
ncbi:translin [Anaeramoeba flamelloides]|uniref:Translin n=1 Tax=Anaeramoeba flamelloides TaxID=1746091 RepID=A0AAV8AF86_9EUKA|nr:translin [Anaeramoeba flamelloides]